ncbi:TadE/TadG family type IV pilus assembly protein [Fulvimarina endophytica]|nr:TadE/TadG family type IV pilus assembly protein [Fulvimarina endophytica]
MRSNPMPDLASLRRKIAAFANARDGVAIVEFALIAPVLILLYVGSFEASRFYEVSRKTNSTSETIGDLVGRTKTVNVAELDNIFNIAKAIMVPFEEKPLAMEITAVNVDSNGTATVAWSRKKGAPGGKSLSGRPRGVAYALPNDLKDSRNAFFIMVDTTYKYESTLSQTLAPSSLQLKKQYAILPRLSATIPCTDCN